MIETTNVNINTVEVQGIWDEKDEVLKEAIAIWGILPKGVTELKERVLEDNVANIIRSGCERPHKKVPLKKEIRVPFRAPLFWASGVESPLIVYTKNKKTKYIQMHD